jgi:hypothetical protein
MRSDLGVGMPTGYSGGEADIYRRQAVCSDRARGTCSTLSRTLVGAATQGPYDDSMAALSPHRRNSTTRWIDQPSPGSYRPPASYRGTSADGKMNEQAEVDCVLPVDGWTPERMASSPRPQGGIAESYTRRDRNGRWTKNTRSACAARQRPPIHLLWIPAPSLDQAHVWAFRRHCIGTQGVCLE